MTDNTATASFLERLRNETAEAHIALERIPVSASLLQPDVTVAQYAEYLKLMYDVVSGLERNVHPIISTVIPDLEDRKKAKDIQSDLRYIGYQTPENRTNIFDTDNSVAYNLGIMYVVEGSTLGGRFILKNIQSVLGFDEYNGASYFAGYGNKTGSMWKNFLSHLTGFVSQTASEQQVIDGANQAFEAIHHHLSHR